MRTALQPHYIDFHLTSGRVEDSYPFTQVLEKSTGSARAFFFVLIELFTQRRHELARKVMEGVSKAFKGGKGTLTTTLERCVEAAHQELRKANLKAGLGEKAYTGISCAIFRGDELYLTQAGPSIAFIAGQGGAIRRLGDPEIAAQASPGIAETVTMAQPFRHLVDEEDVLLLASPALGSMVTDQGAAALLAPDLEASSRRLYLLAKKEASFSALLVKFLGS